MTTNPLVSVLMCVYNGADYLRAAIDSVLKQTYREWEFIIIDDGSDDDSRGIIESYADNRIRAIQQRNLGLTKSLNIGLRMARGKYVARQDADDISCANRFEKQVVFLETYPDVAVLGGAVTRIDEKGTVLDTCVFPQSHEKIVRQLYNRRNPIVHSAVMFRKQHVDIVGNYNEFFERSQDYELWLRVSHKYQLHNLREVLAWYRFSLDSVTQSQENSEWLKYSHLAMRIALEQIRTGVYLPDSARWEGFLEDFEQWYKTVSDDDERYFKANQLLKLSQVSLVNGDYDRAVRLLIKSIRLCPHILKLLPSRLLQRRRSPRF